jgi:hypothetical protein
MTINFIVKLAALPRQEHCAAGEGYTHRARHELHGWHNLPRWAAANFAQTAIAQQTGHVIFSPIDD